MKDDVTALLEAAKMAATQVAGEARHSWLCFFGLHRWACWQQIEAGNVIINAGFITEQIVGRYEIQRRHCDRCSKVQLRHIKSTL